MSNLVSLLRGVPILAELAEAALARLADRCVARTVGAGFTLFRAGDECHGLYVVLAGRVRVYRGSPDGREQTLAMEGPGQPVAELPLVDGGSYPASAVTAEPSQLVFLPRAEFEHALRTDPDVASAVVRALGRRLRHLVQLVETVAFRDVAARLAMLLADYAERDGTVTASGINLTLDRTQDELATEIGTARESVSRAFKQLQGKGLVTRTGNKLRLVGTERLRDWARGGDR
jgi:CRP/FNR family transcriptional regulator